MKTTILTLAVLLLVTWPAPAWSDPPSPILTPYEHQRYDDRLWEVPREPYQSNYKIEEYNSRLDDPPARSQSRVRGQSPIDTTPAPGRTPTRAQQRFQTRETWKSEQRKISERSRVQVPQAPLQVRPGQPAGSRPFKP